MRSFKTAKLQVKQQETLLTIIFNVSTYPNSFPCKGKAVSLELACLLRVYESGTGLFSQGLRDNSMKI